LKAWRGHPDALLVALPRGGVPVAAAVADVLGLPLATWAVRKLSHPAAPEYAIGAIAPLDVVLWDEAAVRASGLTPGQQEALLEQQRRELRRRQQRFGDPEPERLRGSHLLVIDDGIATGYTVRAALTSLRQTQPASLVLAVPVVDQRVVPLLQPLLDELVPLAVVDHLRAVGEWFSHFEQLSDQQVLDLLAQHGRP
jgi:putative phosphoribosyl transferase